MPAVAVLGAGVVGLSSAVVALEAGHDVTVYTPTGPLQTTSAKAAASVIPHTVELAGVPPDVLARSMARFTEIERTDPSAGVRWHTHWEASSLPLRKEAYLDEVFNVAEALFPEVPGGYAHGRSFTTFMAETPSYLPWLVQKVTTLGGRVVTVPAFTDLAQVWELPEKLVLNCTGLGAGILFRDSAVRPVRGQIAVVGPQPQLGYSISHDGFYVYPRATDTVIGGTNQFDADSEQVEPAVIDTLLRAARRILPSIGPEDVIRTYAGLRPYRDGSLRIEAERLGPPGPGSTRIVHNYGHGGAGVTLAWGTAEHAVNLL
ncbi:MAG TPA: FAD-dependent oxidoreductase [Jatrophihabitans sp.]|jgi:D-amino-acid oxidase